MLADAINGFECKESRRWGFYFVRFKPNLRVFPALNVYPLCHASLTILAPQNLSETIQLMPLSPVSTVLWLRHGSSEASQYVD